MRTHTNKFKQEINRLGRQINGKIYYYNNYNLTTESNDLLITENNFELITDISNMDSRFEITSEQILSMSFIKNGNILMSLMKEFDFESTIELRVGTLVNPYFGILVDGDYEFLNYGNYIVKEKRYNMDKNTWSYICYDKMMLFMVPYKPLDIVYPTTIGNFLNKICEVIGINFEFQVIDGYTWIPDTYTEPVYSDLFEGKNYTYRDILDKIAEVFAGNLLINDNDNISAYRLTKFPLPDIEQYVDEFDENFLKNINVNFEKKIGPINKLIIVDSEGNLEYPSVTFFPNPNSKDVFELRIYDNEFTFNGNTSAMATTILAEIQGLEYYYCDFSTTGICYLDYLDRFLITRNNIEYPCLLLNNEITITNGIEETIFADESIQVETPSSGYTTSILNSKETSFIVNKQQNEIKSKVSSGDVISEINQSPEKILIKSNRLEIESDNFKLTDDGTIKSIAGEISGFEISNNAFTKEVNGIYNYDDYDATMLGMYIINQRVLLNSNLLNILDCDNSGSISAVDYVKIKNIISGVSVNTKQVTGSFEINSNNPKDCLVIKDENGEIVNSMGVGGINSTCVITDNFICGKTGTTYSDFSGVTINGTTGNITCVSLTQTSKEKSKKNFEKLTNAKDILNATDIYKYNFKDEDDNSKKSIGVVIGENFNYSKDITSKDNDGVNLYSMVSVLWQVVKEQQEEIDKLKEMIKNGKY